MAIRAEPARGGQPTRDGQAGFTLLEVLVAFIIAGLALGVLYGGAAGGLRTARLAGRIDEALSHARSHLAALEGAGGLAGVNQSGDQSGEDGGGFRWRTRVTPVVAAPLAGAASGPQAAPGPRLVLYDVVVRIDWDGDGGARHVTLQSRRLGISAPPPP